MAGREIQRSFDSKLPRSIFIKVEDIKIKEKEDLKQKVITLGSKIESTNLCSNKDWQVEKSKDSTDGSAGDDDNLEGFKKDDDDDEDEDDNDDSDYSNLKHSTVD